MTLNVIRGNLFQIDNLIGTILNVEFSLYDISTGINWIIKLSTTLQLFEYLN